MSFTKRLLTIVSFILAFIWVTPGFCQEQLELVVGQEKSISIVGYSARYSIADQMVVKAKDPRNGRIIILTGYSPGTTTLKLVSKRGREKNYIINVYAVDPKKITREVKQLLAGISGIAVKKIGVKVVLDGFVKSKADLARVNKVASLFGGQLYNLVIYDDQFVTQKTMVELILTTVDIRDQDSHNMGINWGSPLTAKGYGALGGTISNDDKKKNSPNLSYSIVFELMPQLNMLVMQGKATVHDTNTLVVESGKKATYQAGGQLNIPVAGTGSASVETIPYGTIMNITPRVDVYGNVHLDLNAEVSSLDNAMIVQSVPSLVKNSVTTSVNLKIGESIALWGLLKKVDSDFTKGWPAFHHIPLLGYFFSAENSQHNQARGLIFVTPRVISATSKNNVSKIKKILREQQGEK